MGDQIEITTYPEENSMFYRVPFCGLKVDIKADSGNAAIGLAKNIDENCEYWIIIGYNLNHTSIRQADGAPGQTVETPNILSADEYRSFWLSWHGSSIKFGRDGENKPIVTLPGTELKKLKYVMFAGKGRTDFFNVVHWRFELPPLIKEPEVLPVTGGHVQWVQADNQLPDGAVIGGYENDALYIIRSKHNGSLTPGKFVSSEGVGYISWGGQEHEKQEFEVLVGYDCVWVPTCKSKIPVSAVEGGYSEDGRKKLFIGRAYQNGHLIPGKVQPSHSVCYIPYDGREIAHENYEILVCPNINARCANHTYNDNMENDDNDVYEDFLDEDDV
ncbi:uncharacterized protein LOC113518210 [Galleria mellonella]|uniref:Uncharacterized protein LOC113518210 n=1 Tax=Galleria mellonella TaxID=7137 RepID=A0A6J1X088_GALME|nr:uncharacterized protein LOC113518210 [Galleria mellonella]